MRIGYQGEALSYSDQAVWELFPDGERVGFHSFVAAFESLRDGAIERLVVPIENSTTGSVLPVLDRLLPGQVHIIAEHLVEVRHALLGSARVGPGRDQAGPIPPRGPGAGRGDPHPLGLGAGAGPRHRRGRSPDRRAG